MRIRRLVLAVMALSIIAASGCFKEDGAVPVMQIDEEGADTNMEQHPELTSTPNSEQTRQSLTLPAIFSNNMMFQRDKSIHIWGAAGSDEGIQVTFAEQSSSASARNGQWEVWLDPVAAGGPYELIVKGETEEIRIGNILVGDIWVASGQSNMKVNLRNITSGTDELSQAQRREADRLAHGQLRLFQPPIVHHERPLADYPPESAWRTASNWNAAAAFSAVGFAFGGYLREALDVPIGIIQLAQGSTSAQSWMSREAFHFSDETSPLFEQTMERETDDEKKPSYLYNGMIAPLHPFPVKGVIWYQGERNANVYTPETYSHLMQALIADWRSKWNDELPFLLVQLAGYGQRSDRWPALREEQRKTAEQVPGVGLATAIDLGEETDIHPKNKIPVGYRLALQARCLVYGDTDLVCSGPVMDRAEREGDSVILHFLHTGSGLVLKKETPTGFRLCDEAGACAPAEAFLDGERVIVRAEGIGEPTEVFYAWSGFPEVSLYNREGLPATPFTVKLPLR